MTSRSVTSRKAVPPQAAASSSPIRNPAQVTYRLAYDLDKIAAALPTEDIAPTYKLESETEMELHRAIKLLREATRLIQLAVAREALRYADHCEPDAETVRH
jgi:hypothetical protein